MKHFGIVEEYFINRKISMRGKYGNKVLLLLLLLLLLTAIDLSLGGSSPYTSTDKTNNNKCT
jgi:hypothetical protein